MQPPSEEEEYEDDGEEGQAVIKLMSSILH